MALVPLTPEEHAALLARVADMSLAGNQLQAQLRASEAQLVIARDRNAPRPRIPDPPVFNGETGTAVDDWIGLMGKQFAHFPAYFNSDDKKISHALSYVHSKVTSWYESSTGDRAAAGRTVTTWIEFAAVLRERYQPVSAASAARVKLDTLVQRGAVAPYLTSFYQLMMHIPDMNVKDQIHNFQRGLKQHIKNELNRVNPTTLSNAVQLAVNAESYLPQGPASASSSSYQFRPSYRGGGSASTGAPMDLNVIGDEYHGPEMGDEFIFEENSAQSHSQVALLQAQVRHLLSQQQVQQQVNSMFVKANKVGPKGAKVGSSASSSKSRVENVSKEDYERCRRERVCINCKEQGHIAGGSTPCTKPFRSNW